MPRLEMKVRELQERALFVRRDIVALLAAPVGHSGGAALDTDSAQCSSPRDERDPRRLDDPARDNVALLDRHVTPVIYSLMGSGAIPLADYSGFASSTTSSGAPSKHDTPASRSPPARWAGLSSRPAWRRLAHGRVDRRVYCVMGDGEQQEGQIWEAAMFGRALQAGRTSARDRLTEADLRDVQTSWHRTLADKWRSFTGRDRRGRARDPHPRRVGAGRADARQAVVILAHT